MKSLKAVFLIFCFSITYFCFAQTDEQTIYFDNNCGIASSKKYKIKRVISYNDSLITVADYKKNGNRHVIAEFVANKELYQILLGELYYNQGFIGFPGIRKKYHKDKLWITEVVEPFSFEHLFSNHVEENCTRVDSSLYSGSTYTISYDKEYTFEELYIQGNMYTGQLHGTVAIYNTDGTLNRTYEVNYGEFHGTRTSYEQGKIVETLEYKNGKKVGKPVYYDVNDSLYEPLKNE